MYRKLLATTAVVSSLLLGGTAHAGLFVEGSTFTVTGSNTPASIICTNCARIIDGITQDLLVNIPGTVLGHLNLVVNEVPIAGGGEWITFAYSPPFGSLVGQTNLNWNIFETGLQVNQAVTLTQGFISFDNNGANLAPTSCSIFSGFTVSNAPVGGGSGTGCLGPVTNQQFPAGALPTFGTFIDPFDDIANNGINPNLVTSYFEALKFVPASGGGAVPEPASALVLATGALGLLWARKSGRKSSTVTLT